MCTIHGSSLLLSLAIRVLSGHRHVLPHEVLDFLDASTRTVLSADDECYAVGSSHNEHCTLNALQHRGYHRSALFTNSQKTEPEDCHDASQGEECWNEIEWARNQGIVEHANWYVGLTPSSDVASFQAVVHQVSPDKCPKPCSSNVHEPAKAVQPSTGSEPEPAREPAPASEHEQAQRTSTAPPSGDDCHDAAAGEACWQEIQWARSQGVHEHPDWYPGLGTSASVAAFQAAVHQKSPDKCPRPCSSVVQGPAPSQPVPSPMPAPSRADDHMPGDGDCHDAVAGEECWNEVQWARANGLREHPEWYPDLDFSSDAARFQSVIYRTSPEKCPRPCSGEAEEPGPADQRVPTPPAEHRREPAREVKPEKGKWCASSSAPNLWSPTPGGVPMEVKVLSYNLFWWNLYGLRGGNGDSAGRLIADSSHDQKFDFMGFQECEDGERVLAGQGLLKHYEVIQGEHACCIAYSKRWKLLEKGSHEVAEDMETKYYGKRGAQWIRVQSTWDKRTALFVNHHGPLSVNSGGICGGHATAHNLLSLIAKHGSPGDVIILVGDFNANAASMTIQSLWPHLVHVCNSDSWGGVDNIFSNVKADDIISTKSLGSGGSDHDAIEAVFALGDQPWRVVAHEAESEARRAAKDLSLFPPTASWDKFWCGTIEQDIEYQFSRAVWSVITGAHDPEACCRECQNNNLCKAWVWMKAGGQCHLHGSRPQQKLPRPSEAGVVSGLTAAEAAVLSTEASLSALRKV